MGTRLVGRRIEIATRSDAQKLYAHIYDSDIASRRLLEKLGFMETAHGYMSTYGEWRENGSEYALVVDNNKLT
ncbi:MAG TPA: GNAT family N-acetyltransferase [Firmicutes bacterium]|nr:GNAT family N-acetyltransferase [Candidatus Fermentithermobacillaceae bacterium]